MKQNTQRVRYIVNGHLQKTVNLFPLKSVEELTMTLQKIKRKLRYRFTVMGWATMVVVYVSVSLL